MRSQTALHRCRHGLTKVDWVVLILSCGIVLGLLIPTVESGGRPSARRNQCSTQINNLAKSSIQYEMSHKHLPGYVNDHGTYVGTMDPSMPDEKQHTYRSGDKKIGGWIVSLLSYLDAQPTYEIWTQPKYPLLATRNGKLSFTNNAAPNLAYFQCPASPTLTGTQGRNSYIANCGMHHLNQVGQPVVIVHSKTDEAASPLGISFGDSQQLANGVFNNQYAAATNANEFPTGPQVTLEDFKDGTGNTTLFSESLQAIPWHQLDIDAIDSARLLQPANPGDEVPYPVWSRFTQGMVWHYEDPEGIGGAPRDAKDRQRPINSTIKKQDIFLLTMTRENAADVARPSSAHSDGVNMGFADGSSRFISDSIDYRVYQAMLSPRGKKSLVPMDL